MPVLSALSSPTHVLDGAQFTSLATPTRGSTDTSVWRVQLAPGHPATPHQDTREEVFVGLSGHARVRLGEAPQFEAILLKKGFVARGVTSRNG